jgi:DoxX-like family
VYSILPAAVVYLNISCKRKTFRLIKNKTSIHSIITYFTAAVWLANGLFCKLLNLVPRHQLIVARILGVEYAGILTKAIGTAEVFMAIWIISLLKARLCAITQIVIVAIMNAIEFFKARDLLLFGKINACIAFVFIALIICNEFILQKKIAQS